jgi:hypothetical protein
MSTHRFVGMAVTLDGSDEEGEEEDEEEEED